MILMGLKLRLLADCQRLRKINQEIRKILKISDRPIYRMSSSESIDRITLW
jgi:hypothetical protein